VVEHYDDGDALRWHIHAVTAPAAQRASVAGYQAAHLSRPAETEAIHGGIVVREGHRGGKPRVERRRIVTRRIYETLPGDHVVERGPKTSIAGPDDSVLRSPVAAG